MIDVAGVLLIIVLFAVVCGFLFWAAEQNKVGRLRASAPMELPPTRGLDETLSARHAQSQVLEAVRILSDIKSQDALYPMLTAKERDDVNEYLEEFFNKNKKEGKKK